MRQTSCDDMRIGPEESLFLRSRIKGFAGVEGVADEDDEEAKEEEAGRGATGVEEGGATETGGGGGNDVAANDDRDLSLGRVLVLEETLSESDSESESERTLSREGHSCSDSDEYAATPPLTSLSSPSSPSVSVSACKPLHFMKPGGASRGVPGVKDFWLFKTASRVALRTASCWNICWLTLSIHSTILSLSIRSCSSCSCTPSRRISMGDWNSSLLLMDRRGGVIVPPIDIGVRGSKKETAELESDDVDDGPLEFVDVEDEDVVADVLRDS